MLYDQFEGKGLEHPEIRVLFTRENMLASDWYTERLVAKQRIDTRLWDRHVRTLKAFLAKDNYAAKAARLGIADRLVQAQKSLQAVRSTDYLQRLHGTIGAQPW